MEDTGCGGSITKHGYTLEEKVELYRRFFADPALDVLIVLGPPHSGKTVALRGVCSGPVALSRAPGEPLSCYVPGPGPMKLVVHRTHLCPLTEALRSEFGDRCTVVLFHTAG